MAKNKVIFEKGVFLNKKGYHSDATIWGRMITYSIDGGGVSCDGLLKVRDCNHTVTLNLDWSSSGRSEQSRENVLHKLDSMIKFLTEYKTAIEKKTNDD